jgi:DNA-binding IclR family transcriptional regulator
MDGAIMAKLETSVPPTTRNQVSTTYQLHSLDRAVSILDLLGESSSPLSLADICHQMALHKSTAHRSLMVLEHRALIERTGDNRFRLGMRLHELGNRAVQQVDLRTRANPYFSRLSAGLGETIHLGILNKTSVVYLDKMELKHKVCLQSRAGNSNPVYCTSMGKALLAFQPLEAIDRIIAKIRFVRYTEKTICTREALLKSLDKVREFGYSIDDQEIEMGVRCVGAPIFDGNHRPIAAMSVSGPSSRITIQSVPSIAEQVLRCSREISASFGAKLTDRPYLHSAS